MLGAPMKLPEASSPEAVCVLPDGSVPAHCTLADPNWMRPYPASPAPVAAKLDGVWKWPRKDRSVADFTFRLAAGVQASKTEPHAPEYFVNKKPWQLFHSSMRPLLFEFSGGGGGAAAAQGKHGFDDPVLAGPFPIGSVVDLIIENTLNETVTLYKHGAPTWLLGSGPHGPFPYDSVHEAVQRDDDDDDGQGRSMRLNLETPGLNIVHDIPPLGWSIIRFKVTSKEVTMLHAVKLRHFVVSD